MNAAGLKQEPETTQNSKEQTSKTENVLCDRCGGPMFRMRAVYWCEECGYKTDCCGH